MVPASWGYRPLYKLTPVPRKITFKYNTLCNFVSVSSFTAYIIFTFRVRVRVSVRLRCHLVNKVSVRCMYGPLNSD